MIKRLKRRFIIVNMCILSCVLFSVLATIFILMYNSEIKLSNDLMYSILDEKNMVKSISDNSIDINETFGKLNIVNLNNDMNNNLPLPGDFDDERNPVEPENPYDKNYPPDDRNPNQITPDLPEVTVIYQSPTEIVATEPLISSENSSDIDRIESTENTKPRITDKDFINDVQPPSIIQDYENETNEDFTETSVSLTGSTSTTITTVITESDNTEKPDKKDENEFKPDPFKGKVKRAYIYVEFNNVNDISSISYEFFNDSQNDDEVKKAVIEIYNTKKEQGKISICNNKYRYLFQYDPPKMKYSVIFLDRTLEISTISRLLFIFALIASVGLILTFFISILLTNWTIRPVSKAWDQQKQFIADASHELKTPLTVISTNTDVILSSPNSLVKNQSKWLNYIKNETDRMAKLVNNLLYIAKYDAKKIKMVYNKIDLSNIVSSICLQFEPLVFENNKSLLTDIDKDISIIGDEDKIKQLLNILLDNALKYSLAEGIIKVSLKKVKQSSVCLTVSNSSEEISENQLSKIFDRFYRVDDSRNRKTGGSGLGLNIAQTIVNSHKGNISAVNKNNITSFIVNFNI